jgi:hypothetical protein
MTKRSSALLAGAVLVAAGVGIGTVPAHADDDEPGVLANYHGQTIDLSVSWEGAQACAFVEGDANCFDSEEEMNAFYGWGDEGVGSKAGQAEGGVSLLSNCSSPVRLYASTFYNGATIALYAQGSYLNLSAYGFDNVTSSYKVGACWSAFYDGSGGAPPTYPGSTLAGSSATSMVAGWDNRISSVYIA